MHKLLLPSLIAALGVFSNLTAQSLPPATPASPAAPATPAAPAPAAPSSDPFVRGPHTPKGPTPSATAEPSAGPANLFTTVETWALSKDDFVAVLDGPANEPAPYDRLEALAKAGKAKLVGLIGLSTKSGQRAVVESVDEVIYWAEFVPAARTGEIAFPTSFVTRNTGDTLELEPVVGADGKTIMNSVVSQSVRFEGFLDSQPEAKAMPMGQAQFRTEKINTSMTVTSGHPAFLATATPARADEEQDAKEIHIRVLRTTVQRVQATTSFPGPMNARVEFLLYSLDREAARGVLNSTADSVQSYAAVQALMKKGEARLETVSAFVAQSGQRAINEEIADFHYPTNATAPKFDSQMTPAENRQPSSFDMFGNRNTGVTVEIEPVFGPDNRFVDINIVPQVVRMFGMLKANGAAAKYPQQPVFTTRQVTTSAVAATGVPVLLGTMSQPTDSGVNDRKDDGRTSLAYIRVTAVQP